MGLLVRDIELRNFRSFEDRTIPFAEGMTVLVGPNAAGKTNTVEALQLVTSGQSFRKPTSAQLVHAGAAQGRVRARLEGDGRQIDVTCEIEPSKRRFTWNGKPCRGRDLAGNLMSILFNPDDLSFVKRGASYRRDELDGFGAQANRGYAKVLRAYTRSIEQRNRLLKDTPPDLGLLDAWDASVALGGATLLAHRRSLFDRLSVEVVRIYHEICPGEELSCSYVCSLGKLPAGATRDELADLFATRLAQGREDDLRRQMTLVGPQRDDVAFSIDGRDARTYGSQGQQRTIVLAWKMAEVALSEQILGSKPLLLLDDVMSELDASRRAALTSFVQSGIQTVMTTTNLGYFPQELLEQAEVVDYGAHEA